MVLHLLLLLMARTGSLAHVVLQVMIRGGVRIRGDATVDRRDFVQSRGVGQVMLHIPALLHRRRRLVQKLVCLSVVIMMLAKILGRTGVI